MVMKTVVIQWVMNACDLQIYLLTLKVFMHLKWMKTRREEGFNK